MQIIIGKNKTGITGQVEQDMLIDIFTGEVTDTDEYEEVGYIDKPGNLNSLPGQLFQHFTLTHPLTSFYLVGDVSARERLNYVRLNESVMMGFSNLLPKKNGDVYFFKKCGEMNGMSMFSYMSDMVVKDDSIEWVHQGDSSTIVLHR